jgi:hypothetical protein
MKRKLIIGSMLLFVGISSCIKHEIIPAPKPKVTLDCNFRGFINGTDTELTKNVNGYYLEADKSKFIAPGNEPSKAVYFANMRSAETLKFIRISIGSILWDANVSANPTLTLFNQFMNSNLTPNYSIDAAAGFEVMYRDAAGVVWKSKDTDPVQEVEFSNIKQESDETGDYSKFICSFSTVVYHTFLEGDPDPNDPEEILTADIEYSFPINDAVFKGWFKR